MTNTVYNLFFSYSHADKNKALVLLNRLKDQYSVWNDEDSMKTGNIDMIMTKGIEESEVFICCASKNYCKLGTNSLKEFNCAIAKKKKVIYVLFDEFENFAEIEESLKPIVLNLAQELYFKHHNIDAILKALNTLIEVSFLKKHKMFNNQFNVALIFLTLTRFR